jgi:hypothetical protein
MLGKLPKYTEVIVSDSTFRGTRARRLGKSLAQFVVG